MYICLHKYLCPIFNILMFLHIKIFSFDEFKTMLSSISKLALNIAKSSSSLSKHDSALTPVLFVFLIFQTE